MPVLLIAVVALGLAVGSFLNVVIYRVPAGASLVTPASRCPACEHPIRHRHNVPVLGWIMLGGRCSDCRDRISSRYPLVELGTALLFAAVTLRLAGLHLAPALPAYLYFVAIGIALSMIDLDCKRLPNAIVLPSYAVLAILLIVAGAWQQDWSALLRALIGAAGLFAFYFLLAVVYPAGMGFGDVKLAGLIGAMLGYLSYGALIVGALAAFVLAAVVGVAMIISRRGSGKTAIPYGPYMIVGALLAVFVGDAIANAYLATIIGS